MRASILRYISEPASFWDSSTPYSVPGIDNFEIRSKAIEGYAAHLFNARLDIPDASFEEMRWLLVEGRPVTDPAVDNVEYLFVSTDATITITRVETKPQAMGMISSRECISVNEYGWLDDGRWISTQVGPTSPYFEPHARGCAYMQSLRTRQTSRPDLVKSQMLQAGLVLEPISPGSVNGGIGRWRLTNIMHAEVGGNLYEWVANMGYPEAFRSFVKVATEKLAEFRARRAITAVPAVPTTLTFNSDDEARIFAACEDILNRVLGHAAQPESWWDKKTPVPSTPGIGEVNVFDKHIPGISPPALHMGVVTFSGALFEDLEYLWISNRVEVDPALAQWEVLHTFNRDEDKVTYARLTTKAFAMGLISPRQMYTMNLYRRKPDGSYVMSNVSPGSPFFEVHAKGSPLMETLRANFGALKVQEGDMVLSNVIVGGAVFEPLDEAARSGRRGQWKVKSMTAGQVRGNIYEWMADMGWTQAFQEFLKAAGERLTDRRKAAADQEEPAAESRPEIEEGHYEFRKVVSCTSTQSSSKPPSSTCSVAPRDTLEAATPRRSSATEEEQDASEQVLPEEEAPRILPSEKTKVVMTAGGQAEDLNACNDSNLADAVADFVEWTSSAVSGVSATVGSAVGIQ